MVILNTLSSFSAVTFVAQYFCGQYFSVAASLALVNATVYAGINLHLPNEKR